MVANGYYIAISFELFRIFALPAHNLRSLKAETIDNPQVDTINGYSSELLLAHPRNLLSQPTILSALPNCMFAFEKTPARGNLLSRESFRIN